MSTLLEKLRIDPIVAELLKAGILTYKKHYKAYLLLNIFYIAVFAIILGIPESLTTGMTFFSSIFKIFDSFQHYTQSIIFYGCIGLLITIITYYITFRETLRSGELGLEIRTPWTAINHFVVILFYNLIVLVYLLLWIYFYKLLILLLTFNSVKVIEGEISYAVVFLGLFFMIFLVVAFFLFVVKMSYYIYMLDELKVPTQALDPIIIGFGFLFGLLIVILDLINLAMPMTILTNVSIIITYLTPGTIIMPILGYSMAHLKVAQTVLGFEPLFIKEEPAPS